MGTRYKKLLIFWTLHSLTCHCNSLFPQLREVVLSSHLGFQEPSLPCSLWEKAPGLARIYSVRCYLLHILFCSVSWSHFYSYLCSFSHSSQQFALCSSCCYPTLCVSLSQRSHSFAVLTVHFFWGCFYHNLPGTLWLFQAIFTNKTIVSKGFKEITQKRKYLNADLKLISYLSAFTLCLSGSRSLCKTREPPFKWSLMPQTSKKSQTPKEKLLVYI